MNRIRRAFHEKRLGLALVVASVLALGLALIAFRGIVFKSGLVEFGDVLIHIDPKWQAARYLWAWNPYYSGENAAFISQAPYFALLVALGSSEIAQRVLLVGLLYCIGVSGFMFAFWLTRPELEAPAAYLVSAVALMVYLINPWVTFRVAHWFYLWWYALSPWLIPLTSLAIRDGPWQRRVGFGAIAGTIVALLGAAPHPVLWASAMLVAVTLFELASRWRSPRELGRALLHATAYGAVALVTCVGLSFYWLYPYMGYFAHLYGNGPVWNPPQYLQADVLNLSRQASISNVIRMFSYWWGPDLYKVAGPLAVVWTVASFAVPSVGLLALFLARRNRWVVFFSALALIVVFLGKGAQWPFGELYRELIRRVPSLGWMLRDPDKIVGHLGLVYVVLLVAVLTVLLRSKRKWQRNSAVGLALIVGTSACAWGYPLLSGDMLGWMKPVQLPKDYVAVNRILAKDTNFGRVAWVPMDSEINWGGHSIIPPLQLWVSKRPVLFYGELTNRTFLYYLENHLMDGTSDQLAKSLQTTGTRYVVYHDDTRLREQYGPMLSALKEQTGLRQIFKEGNLTLFESQRPQAYLTATHSAMIATGGLDLFDALNQLPGFDTNKVGVLLAEQTAGALGDLTPYSHLDTWVTTYGKTGLQDLVLSQLPTQFYFSPYFDSEPLDGPWHKDFMNSHLWVPYFLRNYSGDRFSFDLGQGITFTDVKGVHYPFPIHADLSSERGVFVRVLFSPAGGTVRFKLGHLAASVNTRTSMLQGFRWVYLGRVAAGPAPLLDIENQDGFNAVNTFAVVPPDELRHSEERWNSLINSPATRMMTVLGRQHVEASQPVAVDDRGRANLTGSSVEISFEVNVNQPTSTPGVFIWSGDGPVVYGMEILANQRRAMLFRTNSAGGNRVDLASAPVELALGHTYKVRYSIDNGHISLSLDNELVVSADTTAFHLKAFQLYLNQGTNYGALNIVDSTGKYQFHTLKAGRYSIAVYPDRQKAVSTIQVNGTNLTARTEGQWQLFGPIELAKGAVNLDLPTLLGPQGAIVVYQVPSPGEEGLDNLFPKATVSLQPSVARPGRVSVDLPSGGPWMLQLNESFEPEWRARSGSLTISHSLSAAGLNNAFLIPRGHAGTVELVYPPQNAFHVGTGVATTAALLDLIGLGAWGVWEWKRDRRARGGHLRSKQEW